jgi:hypothetical protein
LPGGPGALLGQPAADMTSAVPTGTIELVPVWSGKGDERELVGLESADPEVPVRLVGAAYASPKMSGWVRVAERADFDAQVRRIADRASIDSRGVTTGAETQRRHIPIANEVKASKDYYLAGEQGDAIRLDADQQDEWPRVMRKFLADELRVKKDRIRLDRLGGGKSGDVPYLVHVGKETLGVIKVFKSEKDAKNERDMLKLLAMKDEEMTILNPVRAREMVNVIGEGRDRGPGGMVLMDAAPGKSVSSMVDDLPAEPNQRRRALESLTEHVRSVAQGLAEMHKAFGSKDDNGKAVFMSDAAKRSESTYLVGTKLERARPYLGDHYASVKAKIDQDVVPDFKRAAVPASNNLGDANAGNFIVDPSGKISLIDVGLMSWSLDSKQRGTGTGAADMARFVESLGTLHPGALTDAELVSLRVEFEAVYAEHSGVDMADFKLAERYYQVDMYLGIIRDDPDRILPRLLAVLGL